MNINSVTQLQRWLAEQQIDTSLWGTQGHKAIVDLWREIELGETQLHSRPPWRHVNVVVVSIYNQGRILIEAAQHFNDGRTRYRQKPPSEKMMAGESYAEAARRCIVEELAIEAERITLHKETHRYHEHVGESPSYPNLLTRFGVHTVEATVERLPVHDFCTLANSDPVYSHTWRWQPVETKTSALFDSADAQ